MFLEKPENTSPKEPATEIAELNDTSKLRKYPI